jgi:hypothetical protein
MSYRTIIAGIVLGLVGPGSVQAAQEHYYVKGGEGHVNEISSQDARRLAVDHWEIYFYKLGTTPAPSINVPGFGGMDSNESLDKLMESTRKAIAFDRRYDRWCGCKSDLIHYNYFGPVAVLSDDSSVRNFPPIFYQIKNDLDRLMDLIDKIKFATGLRTAEEAEEKALQTAKDLDPPAFKGYLEHAKLAYKQIAELRAKLTDLEGSFPSRAMEEQLLSAEKSVESNVASTRSYASSLGHAALVNAPDEKKQTTSPQGGSGEYNISVGRNRQSIVISGGTMKITAQITPTGSNNSSTTKMEIPLKDISYSHMAFENGVLNVVFNNNGVMKIDDGTSVTHSQLGFVAAFKSREEAMSFLRKHGFLKD